jgi:cell division protein FtsB
MTRYALAAAVVAILAMGVLAAYHQRRAASLAARLDRAEAQVAAYARAAEVHAAHVKRMAAEAEHWAEVQADLQSMEGRDAPLSDHLSRAARRVWP